MDLFNAICERLPDYSEGRIWCSGDEILVRTQSAAETLADLIELVARQNGEEVIVNTGYYDPEEDKKNGEEDRCTGWYYLNIY